MSEMRRLEIPSKRDVFERGSRSLVRSFEISREEVQRLQKERPELIAAKETGVMLLEPQGNRAWLSYGFESVDVLRREFRPMLEGLANSLREDEARSGIFLWFVDQPNRPYIEPVLADCLFELRHEWIEMALPQLPEEPPSSDDIASGFPLRPAKASEYDEIAALNRESFGDSQLQPSDVADIAQRAAELRVAEERESGRLAGYIGLFLRPERTGEIAPIAVRPAFQRHGLAEAMLRWSLAWFRQQGMRRAKLSVRSENAAAIALYRKLGFAHERSGLTYRRPTDERELAEMAQKRRGTYVKFGDWR